MPCKVLSIAGLFAAGRFYYEKFILQNPIPVSILHVMFFSNLRHCVDGG
jgi:hypothetical protein